MSRGKSIAQFALAFRLFALFLLLAPGLLFAQELDLARATAQCRTSGFKTSAFFRKGSAGGSGYVELQSVFLKDTQRRSTWDFPINLDLSQSAGLKFRVFCAKAELVTQFNVYIQADGVWYNGTFEVSGNGQWEEVFLPKTSFMAEGEASSWKRCTMLRIGAWKGMAGNFSMFITGLEFQRANMSVAILRGSGNGKKAAEIARHARNLNNALAQYGARAAVIDENDFAFQVVRPYRLIVVPSLDGMSQATIDALIQYLRNGGKLGVFHALTPKLAAQLGMPVGKFTLASKVQGGIGGILPEGSYLPLKGVVRQLSGAFIGLEKVPASAKIVAYWANGAGRATGWPAVLENSSGFWMTHVYLNQDPVRGGQLQLSLIDHYAPNSWKSAAGTMLTRAQFMAANSKSARKTEAKACLNEAIQCYNAKGYMTAAIKSQAAMEMLNSFSTSAAKVNAREMRAVWCRYPSGMPGFSWSETFEALSKNGINSVFQFAACPFGVSYPSRLTARWDGADFASCVNAARSQGMRLHAWMNCLGVEDAPPTVLERWSREGRLMVGAKGERLNWLCPNNPENRSLLARLAAELVSNFQVEGLHFDRIRYPGRESCYCEHCRRAFAKYAGVSPSPWPRFVRGGEWQDKWYEFRRASIDSLLREMCNSALAARRNVYISCAVYPDWTQARVTVGQDWVQWCRRKSVSFVCPMNYHSSTGQFQSDVKRQKAQVGKAGMLLPGIGTGPGRLSAEEFMRQVNVTRSEGTYGFIVFDLGQRELFDLFPKLIK